MKSSKTGTKWMDSPFSLFLPFQRQVKLPKISLKKVLLEGKTSEKGKIL